MTLGKEGSGSTIYASVSQKGSNMLTARFEAVKYAATRKSIGPAPNLRFSASRLSVLKSFFTNPVEVKLDS